MKLALTTRYSVLREKGFTLTEIAIALVVFGVLAAISVPIFLNAQRSVSSLDVTTGLVQAASLVDAEKNDNNGLYPKYMPNEVLKNTIWKKFAYTYSDDRLAFCLQGTDSNGNKFFVSSTDREPSSTNCGLPNVGENSATPWNLDTYPAIDVSTYNLTWKANASKPEGSVSWTSGVCSDGTTSYQLKLANTTQGITNTYPDSGQIKSNNGGLSSLSYAPDLTGWLPTDVTVASVAPVCTVSTGGRLYTFIGPYSGATKTLSVPQFPVATTTYNSMPAGYFDVNADNTLTMKAAANFAPISCPTLSGGISGSNSPVYQLIAQQANKSDVNSGYSSSPNITLNLSGYVPDTAKINYIGRSYCQYTRTTGTVQRFSGTDTTDATKDGRATNEEWAPVGQPSAPINLATTNGNGGNVKPDGLTWGAPNVRGCNYGGTIQYSYVMSSPNNNASSYQASTASGLVNWAEGTNYTYYVNAKCVGSNRFSPATAGNSLTFTTGAIAPNASWASNYYTDYSGGRLTAFGGLNQASCNAGETRYRITADQANRTQVVYDGTNRYPNLDLASQSFYGDQLVTYRGQVYCRVMQYNSSTGRNDIPADYYSNTVSSTEYADVADPSTTYQAGTYTSGDPDVIPNQLAVGTPGCPNGGQIQYNFVQESPGNFSHGWTTNNYIRDVGWNPGTYYQYYVQYRCAGNNRISGVVRGSSNGFNTQYNTPHAPGTPGGIWTDGGGSSGVTRPNRVLWYSTGCDRGGTPYYILREVRSGNNYRDPWGGGYYGTDWMANTTVYNVPDNWLRQGSIIGYQVIAQCRNNAGTSGTSNWTGERADYTEIYQPGGVNFWRNNDRNTQWSGVGCGQGAYTQYLWQQYNHNQGQTAYGNAFDKGWGDYYSADVDGYNGYSQGVRVFSRCVGDNSVSGNGESNHIDYQIPVYAPRMQLACKPGSSTKYGDTGATCNSYTLAFNPGCSNAERANYAWNGSSQAGSGTAVSGASNGNNVAANGAFQRSGTKAWGTGWTGSINNAYCQAGNGVNSGTMSWGVNNGTAGGQWNTGNYF